jgi:hypothetical protein
MTPPGAGENGITPEPPKSPRRLRAVEPAEASFERISSVFGSAPRYELEFGKQSPLALTIETGASEFDPDLGGVHLQRPTVRHGADKFELGFSEPNPEPMELLEVSSGAAGIELENLTNANFSEMHLSGGCELRPRLRRRALTGRTGEHRDRALGGSRSPYRP